MFKNSAKALKGTRGIAAAAMLTALYAVLYTVKIPLALESRLSLTFIPVAAAAYLIGPVGSVAVGVCGDLFSCLLFPSGQYFPGFTVSAALVGLIYGLFFDADGKMRLRSFLANAAVVLLVYIVLNTFWLAVLYKKAFIVYLVSRTVKNLIVFPVQSVLCIVVFDLLDKTGITQKYK